MFGFIGDAVEALGDAILPKGTRGSTIGAAIGGTFGGKTGAAIGSKLGGRLSSEIATGSRGQEAVDTPTIAQDPRVARETAQSSAAPPFEYYERNFPLEARVGFPRVPNTTRDMAIGTGVGFGMDNVLEITKMFRPGCEADMKKLVGMRTDPKTGAVCPTVTRKQQATLRKMLEYLPIEEVAYQAGVDVTELARLVAKTFPSRRRGITGSQLSTAKRVNNQILGMAKKLGYNCTPMTKAQLACK
jgi:hypothetical protein